MKEIWVDFIVRIEEADEVAGGFFEALVASGGLTLIFLSDDFDAGVFLGVLCDNCGGIVGGAIVNTNNFKILISLSENGIEAFWKVFGGIVNWNDNGN